MDQARWLLLTGAPRSGTSLLNTLFNLHPQAHLLHEIFLTEVLDLVARLEGLLRPAPPDASRQAAKEKARLELDHRVESFYQARRLEQRRHAAELSRPDLVPVLLGAISGKPALRIVGTKLPLADSLRDEIGRILDILSPVVVVIVRNPLHVINSSMRRRRYTSVGLDNWHVANVEQACLEWWRAWTFALDLLDRGEHPIKFVCYDALCREPDRVMAGLFAFAGLDPAGVAYPIRKLPDEHLRDFLTDDDHAHATSVFRNVFRPDGVWDLEWLLDTRPSVCSPDDGSTAGAQTSI